MNEKLSVKRVRRPADYQLHCVLDYEEVRVLADVLDAGTTDDEDRLLALRAEFNRALAVLQERLEK